MSFYLRKSVSVGPFRFNLSGSTGLNESFQISRSGVAEGFVAAVRYLASVTARGGS
jgi:hypothetical protein